MTTSAQTDATDLQPLRREHLRNAVSGPWNDIWVGANTDPALEGTEGYPRYLIRSNTDAIEPWHRLELVEDLDSAEAQIHANMTTDVVAWWPSAIIDLDTGEEARRQARHRGLHPARKELIAKPPDDGGAL